MGFTGFLMHQIKGFIAMSNILLLVLIIGVTVYIVFNYDFKIDPSDPQWETDDFLKTK